MLRICCECGLTWKTLDLVFFVFKRLVLKQKENLIQSNLTTVLRTFGQLSDLSYTLILSSEERETAYNDVVALDGCAIMISSGHYQSCLNAILHFLMMMKMILFADRLYRVFPHIYSLSHAHVSTLHIFMYARLNAIVGVCRCRESVEHWHFVVNHSCPCQCGSVSQNVWVRMTILQC